MLPFQSSDPMRFTLDTQSNQAYFNMLENHALRILHTSYPNLLATTQCGEYLNRPRYSCMVAPLSTTKEFQLAIVARLYNLVATIHERVVSPDYSARTSLESLICSTSNATPERQAESRYYRALVCTAIESLQQSYLSHEKLPRLHPVKVYQRSQEHRDNSDADESDGSECRSKTKEKREERRDK